MDKVIFEKGLKEWNISFNEDIIEKFSLFSSLLKEENKKMNLTAITDDEGISIKHFLDSLAVFFCCDIKNNKKVIDIGTGAGFPGIPVIILRDDFDITLLDSIKKRIDFLEKVKEKLKLENIELLHERAEILGKNPLYREKYDIALSRAVAPLKILSEYALPFLKTGGVFYAYKSYEIEEELNEAKPIIGNLGGRLSDVKEIDIPFSDIKRKIVEIRKIKPTLPEFPRNNKKIKGKK